MAEDINRSFSTEDPASQVEGERKNVEETSDKVQIAGSGPPSPTAGSEGDSADVGSENATGFGTLQGDEEPMADQLSDVSDTGWDTDLEIEEEKEEYDVTGCKAYLKSCEAMGIVPASYFTRTVQAQESNIHMAHHGVGPRGAKAIAIALTSNTTVTTLDLSDNGIGTEGGVAITTMMKENCYITNLDLSDNDLGPAGAFSMNNLVSFNNTLTHLSLRGNGFDDRSVEPLAEVIKSSYKIIFLDLSHNEFGEVAGGILGPALADSEVLQTLDLSWNHIRGKGAVAIATGLMTNQTLKVLNFSFNGLGSKGAVAMADALKTNSTLEELDISNNRISSDAAVAIAKVLPANDNLKALQLGKNPIEPHRVKDILEIVRLSTTSTLRCLGLDGITVTLEVTKILKDMQESHAHLRVPHGGTGGYREPKPLPEPHEKLMKYAKEHSLDLRDLFRAFDKEQRQALSEENFRKALQHISAPLMEFERQKLIKRFRTEMQPTDEEEGSPEEGKEEKKEGMEPVVYVDYNALVDAAIAFLEGKSLPP